MKEDTACHKQMARSGAGRTHGPFFRKGGAGDESQAKDYRDR